MVYDGKEIFVNKKCKAGWAVQQALHFLFCGWVILLFRQFL